MKKHILNLILIFSFSIINGQTIKILYGEKIELPQERIKNMTEAEKEFYKEHFFSLIYSGGKSIYYPISELKDTTIKETRKIGDKVVPKKVIELKGVTEMQVFIDYVKDMLRIEMSFANKLYSIKDNTLKVDWQISNNSRKILNYNCKFASAIIYGNNVKVWFTDEIPALGVGPYIYGGLPGIILYLNYGDKKIYQAKKIMFLKEETIIKEPLARSNILTFKEYRKLVYGE